MPQADARSRSQNRSIAIHSNERSLQSPPRRLPSAVPETLIQGFTYEQMFRLPVPKRRQSLNITITRSIQLDRVICPYLFSISLSAIKSDERLV